MRMSDVTTSTDYDPFRLHDAGSEVLARAAALVNLGWVQDAIAAKRDGSLCHYFHAEATRFSAFGAIYRGAYDFDRDGGSEAIAEFLRRRGRPDYGERDRNLAEFGTQLCQDFGQRLRGGSVLKWNDAPRRSQDEVVIALEQAALA